MSALFPTYGRFDLKVASAEGMTITDTDGKEYLDFGSGIGVNNLGHRPQLVQEAIEEQLQKYWHVSNLYHNPIQEEVANLLTENSVGEQVFFCNSGAEANEAAIKLARKATQKTKIVSFKQSFHGRTFATMSATGQDKIQEGFGPMLEEFVYASFNDINSVRKAVDNQTAAVMIEVIQGEGGVICGNLSFIKEVEHICERHKALLIIDEIQTGIGRTGLPFGYEHFGIKPDIITVAKGLGNGLPVGAMIAKGEVSEAFGPGSHGSTFGGNPIAMSAARAVLEAIFQTDFLQEVKEKGNYIKKQLVSKIGNLPTVYEVRGKGLMIGIDCTEEVLPIVQQLMEKGLIVLSAGPNVIRLLPPLTVSKEEIDKAVGLIHEVLLENIK